MLDATKHTKFICKKKNWYNNWKRELNENILRDIVILTCQKNYVLRSVSQFPICKMFFYIILKNK